MGHRCAAILKKLLPHTLASGQSGFGAMLPRVDCLNPSATASSWSGTNLRSTAPWIRLLALPMVFEDMTR